MNIDEQKRENNIHRKMATKEKVCYNCYYFVEHRIPEMIEKHGKFSGLCIYKDTETTIKKSKSLIVMGDSICEKWTSLFPPDQ